MLAPLEGCACLALAASSLAAAPGVAESPAARLLRFEDVRDVVEGFTGSGIVTSGLPDQTTWDGWIGAREREVRARIDRGIEDSISNLLLYGSSFTSLPRLESAQAAVTPDGQLVPAARARARALADAVAQPQDRERLRFAREFLSRRQVGGGSIEGLLEANLRRFASEQRAYEEKLEAAGKRGDAGELLFTRSTLYQQRGLSVDTSLLPNYAIEDTLRAMMRKGALPPGSVHRIAVIGPGLDFADKREGYDYYPLQTIQPFAIMEAVVRLQLARDGKPGVMALDLNPLVIAHVRRAVERARAGLPYMIQLPRDTQAKWNQESVAYWEHFGNIIGAPVNPLPAPPTIEGIVARAVAVRPQYAVRLSIRDLDIVAQTLDNAPGAGFELVVATNVLVYYDLFEQALAMAAIAHMMNPGGVLLVNHTLPAMHPLALEYLGRRSVTYSSAGAYGDDVVVYRRR